MAPKNEECPSISSSSESKSSSSQSLESLPQRSYDEWSNESAYRFLLNNVNQNVALNYIRDDLPLMHRQPTLLDLIIQSSGSQNVTYLKELKLRVISACSTLCHLSHYTPHLNILILDGSGLVSLREIGTTLKYLTILRVSNCGLTSLDGTFGLSTLKELYASENQIENLAPCAALENINVLAFDRNPIKTMSSIAMLSFCPKLAKLSLKETPLSRISNYREMILTSLPSLEKLDDLSSAILQILEENSDLNSMDSSSISSMTEVSIDFGNSRSSSSKSRNSSSRIDISKQIRPATSLGILRNSYTENDFKRPKTAMQKSDHQISEGAAASCLTSGSIICGNLGRALAKNRSRTNKIVEDYCLKQHELATNVENATKFLEILLPEKPAEASSIIDLELGICSNSDENRKFENEEPLTAIKMWKRAFRAHRKRQGNTQEMFNNEFQ